MMSTPKLPHSTSADRSTKQARSDSKISVCEILREFLRNQREFSVLDENFRLARLLGCCFDFLCVFL